MRACGWCRRRARSCADWPVQTYSASLPSNQLPHSRRRVLIGQHHPRLPQRIQLRFRESMLPQHFVRVLPERRRRAPHPCAIKYSSGCNDVPILVPTARPFILHTHSQPGRSLRSQRAMSNMLCNVDLIHDCGDCLGGRSCVPLTSRRIREASRRSRLPHRPRQVVFELRQRSHRDDLRVGDHLGTAVECRKRNVVRLRAIGKGISTESTQ